MKDGKVVVLIMRSELLDLDPKEIAELEKTFSGKEFEFHSSYPHDYRDHAENCRKLNPDVVILPKDRPIPSLAMEEGFIHVAFTELGILELEPLTPKFKPFVPRG